MAVLCYNSIHDSSFSDCLLQLWIYSKGEEVMSFTFIMSVIVLHWLADFVLQTDWQAKNKSSNNIALIQHVGTYTSVIAIFAIYMFPITLALGWIVINGVLHFITDYFTSRLNTYLWSKGRVHDFFVSVGFDQVIHYFCLFGTLIVLGIK
jgi:hypothetical protein